jgi:ureidoglycolate lyase
MKELKVKELEAESFLPFGYFANLLNPDTEKLGATPIEFYRDMLPLSLGEKTSVSFSVCRVGERPRSVNVSEYHSSCGEGILPLDNDILIHVGPASRPGFVPLDKFTIFRVPKGTMVILKPGVWHHAPYVAKGKVANVLIALPERTYANDCQVVKLKEKEKIKII